MFRRAEGRYLQKILERKRVEQGSAIANPLFSEFWHTLSKLLDKD
jgi:hypothetical protein